MCNCRNIIFGQKCCKKNSSPPPWSVGLGRGLPLFLSRRDRAFGAPHLSQSICQGSARLVHPCAQQFVSLCCTLLSWCLSFCCPPSQRMLAPACLFVQVVRVSLSSLSHCPADVIFPSSRRVMCNIFGIFVQKCRVTFPLYTASCAFRPLFVTQTQEQLCGTSDHTDAWWFSIWCLQVQRPHDHQRRHHFIFFS